MTEARRSRTQNRHKQKVQQLRFAIIVFFVAVMIYGGVQLFQHKNNALAEGDHNPPVQNGVANTTDSSNLTGNTDNGNGKIPVVSEEDSWKTILVNKDHLLADGYVPELVSVDDSGFKFDSRAAESLKKMLQDARDAGLSPMICSSYRGWEKQTNLFEKQVTKQQATGLTYEEAYEKAKTVVAYPGTSEHQSGLAADIVASSHQLLDDSQADTPEQQWLMANCAQYGFILRYPLGKSEFTGVIYEPWHYRYVGEEVAQYITENKLCLEEYWQQLENQQ